MKQLSNIASIRRENTLRLMDQKKISRAELAKAMDMGYSLISAYIGKTPTKAIGDDVAARIEDALDLKSGDLDVNHELIEKFALQNTPIWDKNTPQGLDLVPVPLYVDVRASCGSGYLNSEYEQNLEVVMLETEKVSKRGINPLDVKAFKADGDSMLPIIPHNAEVFVDTSKTSIVRDGAIYAVCLGGLLLIKRVFKAPNGSYLLVSENPNKALYKDIEVNDNTTSFSVLGPVFHVDFSIPF